MRSSKYGLGLAVAATCMAFGTASASAANVQVNGADGTPDAGGCGSAANPCDTIQAGVDNAAARDVVEVAAGNYAESPAIAKPLTLRGAQAGRDARTRAPGNETVVTSPTGTRWELNADNIRIDGFTVKGPIAVADNQDLRVVNNIVQTTNTADILISGERAIVSHNFFDNGIDDGTENGQNTGIVTGFTGNGGLRDSQIVENNFAGHESSAVNLNDNSQDVQVSRNQFTNDSSALVAVDTSDVTFSDNVGSGFLRGSAVYLGVRNRGTTVSGNVLSNGQFSGVSLSGDDFGGGVGPSQGVDIVGNSFSNFAQNTAESTTAAAIRVSPGTYSGVLDVHYNRIQGNTRDLNNRLPTADGSVNASFNFWGCNAGPNGGAGCDGVENQPGTSTTATPYLQLTASSDKSSIFAGGDSALVTARLLPNTGATPADLTFPDVNVTFGTNAGSVSPTTASLEGGEASTRLTSQATAVSATDNVTATLDAGSATAPVAIQPRPANGSNGAAGGNGAQGPAGATGPQGAAGQQGLTPSSTTTTGKVSLVSKSLKASKKTRKVSISVSCPRANGLCEGRLNLILKGKTIARTAFNVRGGRSGKVTVTLSKKAYKALKKSQKVKVDVFSRDLAGAASAATKSLTLKK